MTEDGGVGTQAVVNRGHGNRRPMSPEGLE